MERIGSEEKERKGEWERREGRIEREREKRG